MTSIVIWINEGEDEFLPGVWAVSDSRISGGTSPDGSNQMLTESYPKISVVHAMALREADDGCGFRETILSFGFAFSGSTLIGSTIREILGTLLSNLKPVSYYDCPNYPFEKRIPALKEVADLAGRIAVRYVRGLGVFRPLSAKIESVVFGYCARASALKAFKIRNDPGSPADVKVTEIPLRDAEFFVMGDRVDSVEKDIQAECLLHEVGSLGRGRAPISALRKLSEKGTYPTIGGRLQLCAAGRFGCRFILLSNPDELLPPFVDFNLLEGAAMIGGFSYEIPLGLAHP